MQQFRSKGPSKANASALTHSLFKGLTQIHVHKFTKINRSLFDGEKLKSVFLFFFQLVSNAGDSSATMKPLSTPGSLASYESISSASTPPNNNPSYGYQSYAKPPNPPNAYIPLGAPELNQMDFLSLTESVACSTEDDWDEQPGFRAASYRGGGARRYQRERGRGRGGHDTGRGVTRRRGYGGGGESGTAFNYQFYASNRGRGRERGY